MNTAQTAPLDPRVGIVMREGREMYYAAVGGEFPVRASIAEIMDLLKGAAVATGPFAMRYEETEEPEVVEIAVREKAPVRKTKLKKYIVSVEKKYPAWDDRPYEEEIHADNAAQAVRRMRDKVSDETGHSSRIDGALFVKARRADD